MHMTEELVEDAPAPLLETRETTHFDLAFPVEVGDGRKLQIQWNFGDDPHQVASEFAEQHLIMPDELPTIEAFIMHASTLAMAQRASSLEATQTDEMPSATVDEEMLAEQGGA